MTFCTAHNPIRSDFRTPSQIALAEPRRRVPVRPAGRTPIFSDWAAI